MDLNLDESHENFKLDIKVKFDLDGLSRVVLNEVDFYKIGNGRDYDDGECLASLEQVRPR